MIELRYCKRARYVTGTTVLACHNVASILSNRTTSTTIMTRIAPSTHNVGVGMVHISLREINAIMTSHAIFVCTQMNCRSRRPSRSDQNIIGIAIVTGFTIVSDTRVNEALRCRERCSRSVAQMTILGRG